MRVSAVTVAALAVLAAQIGSAWAAPKKAQPDPVMRTASGTVIQPTKTIIHHEDGSTTVIVIPRRSYLDTGTEVSVGDRHFRDYAMPPGGDPGRANWTMGGPDLSGNGNYLPMVSPMYIPGFNPSTPF
jgi:hypothetical protein